MERTIGSILEKSFTLNANSPLCIETESSSPSSKGEQQQKRIVTYAHAQSYIQLYKEWIITRIHDSLTIHQNHNKHEDSSFHTNSSSSSTSVSITMAFLGSNSLDYLLAVLASCTINSDHHYDDYTINTCLLNIRWTSSDIANTLRVQCKCMQCSPWLRKSNPINNKTTRNIITFILYSPNKQKIAQQAQILLSSFPCNNHFVYIFPLPFLTCHSPLSSTHNTKCHYHHRQQEEQHEQSTSFLDEYSSNISLVQQITNRTALIFFTSGTTSSSTTTTITSKGCCLSHRSLFIQAYAKTQYPCSYHRNTSLYITPLPLFHIGGFSSALAILFVGGTFVFSNPNEKNDMDSFNPIHMISVLSSSSSSSSYNQDKKKENNNDDKKNNHDSIPIQSSEHNTILVNTLVVVPAILHSLFTTLQQQQEHDIVSPFFTNIQLIVIGAQSLTQQQLQSCHYYFPYARIIQTFACTEAGSSITFVDLTHVQSIIVGLYGGIFVGYPPKHIEIQIIQQEQDEQYNHQTPKLVDDDRKNTMNLNSQENSSSNGVQYLFQLGLISTRGSHVMNQYWCREDLLSSSETPHNNYNATAATDADGWLITNDLGYLTDQGGLFYCGRSDDVVRTGGESVLAMEVEMILIQHPMIDTACVFPLHDEKFGSIVCAAIIPKQQQQINYAFPTVLSIMNRSNKSLGLVSSSFEFKDILEFCTRQQLAKYKHPKKIFLLRSFPRNSSGKILKQELIKICSAMVDNDTSFGKMLSKL